MHMRKIYAAILTAGAMAAYAIVALAGPNDPIPLSGYVRVQNGGTGAQTLSGLLKGNGTSAVTTATGSDITSSFTGTCDSTTFLRGDGACATPSGTTSGNPTASVGLTAVNGVASTYMRSDAAPALSQSITPTWTGTHTFNASGESITVKGNATGSNSFNYVRFRDSAGTSQGYIGKASISNNDLYFDNDVSGGNIRFDTVGTGSILGNGVDMTPSTGTQSVSVTSGCTTNPSVTAQWTKIGKMVFVMIPVVSCTSDGSGTLSQGTLPAEIRPSSSGGPSYMQMNCGGVSVTGTISVNSSGSIIRLPTSATCNSGSITFSRATITYATDW